MYLYFYYFYYIFTILVYIYNTHFENIIFEKFVLKKDFLTIISFFSFSFPSKAHFIGCSFSTLAPRSRLSWQLQDWIYQTEVNPHWTEQTKPRTHFYEPESEPWCWVLKTNFPFHVCIEVSNYSDNLHIQYTNKIHHYNCQTIKCGRSEHIESHFACS